MNHAVVQFLGMHNHKHHKTWDEIISYIQHSYSRAQHSSVGKSPFEVYYGFHPTTLIVLFNRITILIDIDLKQQEVFKALNFMDRVCDIQKRGT